MGGKVQKSRYRAMCAQYTIPGFKRRAVEENGLPQWLSSKESTCKAGDTGSIPGSERSPGEGNDYPIHYSSWRIPWTEEPGWLQSMGSQKVRYVFLLYLVLYNYCSVFKFINHFFL